MKKIIIDFSKNIIRTALVEDGKLIEIMIDDYENKLSLGNVFLGKVQNILPNRFAFIDIGLERNAFMNLNDNKESMLFRDDVLQLKQGQNILVQLLKSSTSEKSEVVTTQLTFHDRSIVLYMNPTSEIGVSKKIKSRSERIRLKKLAEELLPEGYSIILRTNSENKSNEELCESISLLTQLAESVKKRAKHAKPPTLVYKEDFLLSNTLKDLYSSDLDCVIINSDEYLTDVKGVISEIGGNDAIVSLYNESVPIFEAYSLMKQIDSIMSKKIWLKSGGFIIIEQTEACVVIDVNTGKYTGSKDLRKSVLKTNTDAAVAIAAQIRLRNLSGLIIIDFIDMREHEDKAFLRKVLTEELKKDRVTVNIVGMTRLGLMQLTRKKTHRPVLECLTTECPHCKGNGRIISN